MDGWENPPVKRRRLRRTPQHGSPTWRAANAACGSCAARTTNAPGELTPTGPATHSQPPRRPSPSPNPTTTYPRRRTDGNHRRRTERHPYRPAHPRAPRRRRVQRGDHRGNYPLRRHRRRQRRRRADVPAAAIGPARRRVSEGRMSYDAESMARAARVTYRELDHWTTRGYLIPDEQHPGTGHIRRWSQREAEVARVTRRLRDAGFRLHVAASLARDAVYGRSDSGVAREIGRASCRERV